jgi:hypothetical protein
MRQSWHLRGDLLDAASHLQKGAPQRSVLCSKFHQVALLLLELTLPALQLALLPLQLVSSIGINSW